jgi:hypothetical protein
MIDRKKELVFKAIKFLLVRKKKIELYFVKRDIFRHIQLRKISFSLLRLNGMMGRSATLKAKSRYLRIWKKFFFLRSPHSPIGQLMYNRNMKRKFMGALKVNHLINY